MAKAMRNKDRASLGAMVYAQMDSWLRSPRTVVMLVCLFFLCFQEVNPVSRYLFPHLPSDPPLYYGETLMYSLWFGCQFYLSSTIFLITISELPRQIVFQNFMMIRSNRYHWLLSQILYCVCMAAFVILFICVGIALFAIPMEVSGSGWSKVAMEGGIQRAVFAPECFAAGMSRGVGILLAVLPLASFFFTMAMLILFCSLMGSSYLGLILCGVFIFSGMSTSMPYPWIPTQYAYLAGIINPDDYNPWKFPIVMIGYVVLNALLIAGMTARVRRNDLVFSASNRF